jgi:hypothetical protein
MSSDLSEDEQKVVSNFRQEKKRKAAEKAQKLRDALPLEELTREELILRLKKMEVKEYIRQALSRRDIRNQSGDWSWHHEDRASIHAAYEFVGERCPSPCW